MERGVVYHLAHLAEQSSAQEEEMMLSHFHSVILDLHNALRAGTTAPLHESCVSESVVPLVPSAFTIALSAHASAVMWELRQPWESTPTLHSFLKIDETQLRSREWEAASEERRRRDGSTMLDPLPEKGSSVMSEW